MMHLSNKIRRELVSALREGASYRSCLDLSQFLSCGVTEQQIGLIDHVINTLYEHPYLTYEAFIEDGYSTNHLTKTLGNFETFKSLIGLNEYPFESWLAEYGSSDGAETCIPYEVYQFFAEDIRRQHLKDSELHGLRVRLGNEHTNTLRFRCGTRLSIPCNEREIAQYVQISRCGCYQRMNFSATESCLYLDDCRVEICIYASQAQRVGDYIVCLVDDLDWNDNDSCKNTVFTLQEFAIQHDVRTN